jgi:hypothetical protein
MLLEAVWEMLEENVFPQSSTGRLFNLYKDRDPQVDLPEAPAIRRANLRSYLNAYDELPDVFLLAEAPGPWGCRFSGVPITSEAQLLDTTFPVHGDRTSITGSPHTEYSAGIHWRVLARYFPAFLTWNTVPFHPHRRGEPLSIRTPTAGEIDAFVSVVKSFLGVIQPRYVAAVGRKAQRALDRLDVPNTYVRHPSQGGARIFEEQVIELLKAAGIA